MPKLTDLRPSRLRELRPSTMLSMAVAVALVLTTGGALVARATGLWAAPEPQVAYDAVPTVPTETALPLVTPGTPEATPTASEVPTDLPTSALPAAPAPVPAAVGPWTPAPTSAAPTSAAPTSAAPSTPTPTRAVPTTAAPTTAAPTVAPLTCEGRSGYDLAVCGQAKRVAAADSGSLSCTTSSAEARCGDGGYAVTARQSGGKLLVRYFPAYVACLPGSSGDVDRFDCLRLGGGGESSPRPDNAFLEVWTDGDSVTGRTVPRSCTVSASFTCGGVSVALGSSAISVEYAASAAVICAGFPDASVGAVLVRCGYR